MYVELRKNENKIRSVDNSVTNKKENGKQYIKKNGGLLGGNITQRFVISGEKCKGLNGLDTDDIDKKGQHAKAAYNYLINDRANFKAVAKAGGTTNSTVDSKGRVTGAWMNLSGKGTRESVQTTIGWIGRLEEGNLNADYNGGHLIATSLGGPGTWGNMVPQDGPENKWGDWRKFEAAAKKDIDNGTATTLTVDLGYSGENTLPSSWKGFVNNASARDAILKNGYSGTFTYAH